MRVKFRVQLPEKQKEIEDKNDLLSVDSQEAKRLEKVYEKLNLYETLKITKTIKRRTVKKKGKKSEIPEKVYRNNKPLEDKIKEYEASHQEAVDDIRILLKENQKLIHHIRYGDAIEGEPVENFELNEEIAKLKDRLSNLDNEYEEQIEGLRAKVKKLQKDLDQKEDELFLADKKIKELDDAKEDGDDELKRLRKEAVEREDNFDDLNRYISDLLEEKTYLMIRIDGLQRDVEDLKLERGASPADLASQMQDEVMRIEDKYKLKIEQSNESVIIMKRKVEKLEEVIQDKDREIIRLTTKEKETITTTNELKTQETKVVKLKAKERLTEWKEVFRRTTDISKDMKALIEDTKDEKIHDNLDFEITEKTGIAYAEPIMIMMDKLQKYYKELNRLLKEQESLRLRNEQLEKENRRNKGKEDVSRELSDILDDSKKSTDFFLELVKLIKKEKYINFKNIEIASGSQKEYCSAISEYLESHQGYYDEIREGIKQNNKELARLKEFEKNVLKGRNKDNCKEDFQRILEKNIKLNITLGNLMNMVEGKDVYKHEKVEINSSTSPQELIEHIYDEFDNSNRHCRFISNKFNDFVEENEKLKANQGSFKKKPKGVEMSDLMKIAAQSEKLNTEVKELAAESKADIRIVETKVSIDANTPPLYLEEINKLNIQTINDVRSIKNHVKHLNNDLEHLRELEDKMKEGKSKGAALNDYRFILKKAEKLRENLTNVTKLTDLPALSFKDKSGINSDNPDDYIDAYNISNKDSNKTAYELEAYLRDYNQEVERLRVFEKEVKAGLNKEASRRDFQEIHKKCKQNLKDTIKCVERAKDDIINENVSQIFDDSPSGVLDAIYINQEQAKQYNRELFDLVSDLKDENDRLKKFEQDVKNGKNKEGMLDDLKRIMSQSKELNDEIKITKEKANNKKGRTDLSIMATGKDPNTYLEALNKYHEKSLEDIIDLRELINKNNAELKKLQKFQEAVLNGENKIGALQDLKKLCQDNVKIAKDNKETTEKAGETSFFDNLDFDMETDNPNHFIAYIEETQAAMRKYNKELKRGLEKQKEHNERLKREFKGKEDECEEYIAINRKQEVTIIELEGKMESLQKASVSNSTLVELINCNNDTIEYANSIISERTEVKETNIVKFDEEEKDSSVLIEKLFQQISVLKIKYAQLKETESPGGKVDIDELVDILKKLESFKEEFLDAYETITMDTIDDTTNVDLTQANTEENVIEFLKEDAEFFNESIEVFKDELDLTVSNLTKKKNELLNENEKLKTLLNDLQEDLSVKTMLLGKLQVKLLIVLGYVGSLEENK